MHYLKSTTQKSYVFDGKRIPPAITKDNEFLAMTDKEYATFEKRPVIGSLIKSGLIFVTTVAPAKPEEQLKSATQENTRLLMENTRLQEELRKARSSSSSTEVEELKAALEKQVADDTAEIKALQEAKDAEIADLKKQLAAAKKGQKGE